MRHGCRFTVQSLFLLSSHEWRERTLQWQYSTAVTVEGFLIASSKFHLLAEQNHLDRMWSWMVTYYDNRSSQIFQRSRSRLESLGWHQARLHTEDPKILCVKIQNLFFRLTWQPRFVRPWWKCLYRVRFWLWGFVSTAMNMGIDFKVYFPCELTLRYPRKTRMWQVIVHCEKAIFARTNVNRNCQASLVSSGFID